MVSDGGVVKHYQVLSPVMEPAYSSYKPLESFCCFGLYLAKNAKDAIRQAVKDPEFSEWVKEARGDGHPPFKGLKAELALCSHGKCWGCEEDVCTECEQEGDDWLIEVTS